LPWLFRHQRQKDKAGAPYILHPLRLMLRMDSEPAMMVAVLWWKTALSLENLRELGFQKQLLLWIA